MKTSPEDIEVLLVGGGSIITPPGLVGVARISRPPFYAVANAVGAAMARGKFDTMFLAHSFSRGRSRGRSRYHRIPSRSHIRRGIGTVEATSDSEGHPSRR